MPRTVAIVQARMSSSRLPGKVLKPLSGVPALLQLHRRVLHASSIDLVVVATSDEASDDPLEAAGKAAGIPVYRGSLSDVLGRFYGCAREHGATTVVRLTGDNPAIDPGLVDVVVGAYFYGGFDYYALAGKELDYPNGLECEVFSFEVLELMHREARLDSEREHVTPYIRWNHSGLRRVGFVDFFKGSGLGVNRWTMDYPEDFELMEFIYAKLCPNGEMFTMQDVLALKKEHPEAFEVNAVHTRDSGYQKSLEDEKKKELEASK